MNAGFVRSSIHARESAKRKFWLGDWWAMLELMAFLLSFGMIKLFIGSIGSGKSLSAVRFIYGRENKVFCNFACMLSNAERLKTEYILKKKEKKGYTINWQFWNEARKQPFDIVIDEIHNILHSRKAMTGWNTSLSMWLAQIRKVLSNNEKNHLILISQKPERVDIAARDLAQEVVYCWKKQFPVKVKTAVYDEKAGLTYKMLPKTYIIQEHFLGNYCMDKFQNFLAGEECQDRTAYFLANPYFRYYNSYEILDFGEEVYL